MVVFTCSSCGQSVKKNQVENHCNYQCRNCESLSCMDCGKVFWGDDYKEHIKCITEDQKYGGKDYQAKPNSNKGEVKQEKWIEHVKNVISTRKLSGPLKNYLEQIVLYSNIPRKKSKFENFLKNSLKLRNPTLISEAWEIFSQSTSNETKPNEAPKSPHVNGVNNVLKRPLDDKEEIHSKKICLNGAGINGLQERLSDSKEMILAKDAEEFRWVEVIESILRECPENTIDLRPLRKLVTAQYKATVKKLTLSKNDIKKKLREILESTDIFNVIGNK